MPLLVALDECNCTLTSIELYAQLGLRHPEIRDAALLLVLAKCHELDETIGGITPREHSQGFTQSTRQAVVQPRHA